MNPNAPEKLNHPLFLIANEKIHAALPGIVPSAGHDLVDEIIELHRLARSQLDTEMELRRVAEKNYSDLVALCTGDAPIDSCPLHVSVAAGKISQSLRDGWMLENDSDDEIVRQQEQIEQLTKERDELKALHDSESLNRIGCEYAMIELRRCCGMDTTQTDLREVKLYIDTLSTRAERALRAALHDLDTSDDLFACDNAAGQSLFQLKHPSIPLVTQVLNEIQIGGGDRTVDALAPEAGQDFLPPAKKILLREALELLVNLIRFEGHQGQHANCESCTRVNVGQYALNQTSTLPS
jgi:hypothetical protein